MKKSWWIRLLAAFLLVGCASSPAPVAPPVDIPAWYKDKEGTYPGAQYLAYVGNGANAQGARQDALSQLSQYFGLSVQTFTSSFEAYKEEKTNSATKSSLDRQVSTKVSVSSDQKLFNVEYTNPFELKAGQVYVVAYLNRAAAAKSWGSVIDSTASRAALLIGVAKDGKQSVGHRLAAWRGAQILAEQLPALQKNWRLIAPEGSVETALPFSQKDLLDLKTRLTDLGAMDVKLEGSEADRFGPQVEDRLSKAGFLTGKGGKLQVRGSVKVTTSPGSYGLTNAQWQLTVAVNEGETTLFSMALEGKAGGSNPEAAKIRALSDAGKELDAQFLPGLTEKFASFLE